MTIRAWVTACTWGAVFLASASLATAQGPIGYKLLATSKTSTMEKEMNGAADAGFRFAGVMGGDTAVGGQEVVAIMTSEGEAVNGRFHYKLLATTKTSTMQKEMQAVGDAGYEYKGQTMFKSAFGGEEVVVILERDRQAPPVLHEYRLLATSKTSTMEKELGEAGRAGFQFVGLTVSKTAMGGSEVVVITRRQKRELGAGLVRFDRVDARRQAAGVSVAGPLEQCRHGSPDTGPQLRGSAGLEPADESKPSRPATPAASGRRRRGPVSGAATGPPTGMPVAPRRASYAGTEVPAYVP